MLAVCSFLKTFFWKRRLLESIGIFAEFEMLGASIYTESV